MSNATFYVKQGNLPPSSVRSGNSNDKTRYGMLTLSSVKDLEIHFLNMTWISVFYPTLFLSEHV